MAEPNSTILTRIHAAHPSAEVKRVEGGVWQAIIRQGSSEQAIYRKELADLENRLNDLAAAAG